MTKRTIKLPPGIARMINNPARVPKASFREIKIQIAVANEGRSCHVLCPAISKELNDDCYQCSLFGRIGEKLDRPIACRMCDPLDQMGQI